MKLSGCIRQPHHFFSYDIAGTAIVQGMTEEKADLHPMYKYPSRYTCFHPLVAEFAARVKKKCLKEGAVSPMEIALCAMDELYRRFRYEPGMTDIHTTAAEALVLGRGVCQDYAHIMIAVLRYLGVAARYVNGLMIGEGSTHAWVEIYTGTGWYGLDPTNNLHIDDYYIKLACGRDYGDCVIDKGRFTGNAGQTQEIYVNVEEITDDKDRSVNGTAGR